MNAHEARAIVAENAKIKKVVNQLLTIVKERAEDGFSHVGIKTDTVLDMLDGSTLTRLFDQLEKLGYKVADKRVRVGEYESDSGFSVDTFGIYEQQVFIEW